MYVFVGGESSLESQSSYLHTGLMYDMAKKNGAYMVLPEHRYYGQSIPIDLNEANMKYLTVDQAMADLANFIQERKKAMGGLNKVGLGIHRFYCKF